MKTYEEMADCVLERITVYKKKQKSRRYLFRCISAILSAFVIVLLISINLAVPAYARDMPVLGNVFSYVQDNLDFMGIYSKYAFSIGDKSENNNISVTLSEVYCDGNNLFVSYIIESELFGEELLSDCYSRNQIGYSATSYYSYSGNAVYLNDLGVTGIEGYFCNNSTFVGVETLSLNKSEFPETFTLHISIESIDLLGKTPKIFKGNWNFDIKVNTNKNDCIVYDINRENNGHSIDQIIASPIMLTVYTSYPDLYSGTVRYMVIAYSDLSPDKDITQMGEYSATTGVTKIPRNRIGKFCDIYVIDNDTFKEDERPYTRETVENHAIVSAHVSL